MIEKDDIFYVAAEMLECASTIDDFLELDTDTIPRLKHWADEAYEFNSWLSEEILSKPDDRILIDVESLCGSFASQCGQIFQSSAHQASIAYPQISRPELLYFYYCHLFAGVLVDFNLLVQEHIDPSSGLYQRYDANKDKLIMLVEILRGERPNLDESQSSLLDDIEAKAKLLVAEWRRILGNAIRGVSASE